MSKRKYTLGQPHLTAVRQFTNSSNMVTGASILYYEKTGSSWTTSVVTSTTSQPANASMRTRVVIDHNGQPVIAYVLDRLLTRIVRPLAPCGTLAEMGFCP